MNEPDEIDAADRSLSLEEVADLLSRSGHPVALRTLRDHCSAGVLPAVKVRRSWKVDPTRLPAYVAYLSAPQAFPHDESPAAGGAPTLAASAELESVEERDVEGRLRSRAQCKRGPDGRAVKHGTFVGFHADGSRSAEGSFKDGRLDGAWTQWHSNGRVAVEGGHRRGAEHGRWTFFDSEGRKVQEGAYRDGLADGRWTYWHASGAVWKAADFDNGRQIGPWTISN